MDISNKSYNINIPDYYQKNIGINSKENESLELFNMKIDKLIEMSSEYRGNTMVKNIVEIASKYRNSKIRNEKVESYLTKMGRIAYSSSSGFAFESTYGYATKFWSTWLRFEREFDLEFSQMNTKKNSASNIQSGSSGHTEDKTSNNLSMNNNFSELRKALDNLFTNGDCSLLDLKELISFLQDEKNDINRSNDPKIVKIISLLRNNKLDDSQRAFVVNMITKVIDKYFPQDSLAQILSAGNLTQVELCAIKDLIDRKLHDVSNYQSIDFEVRRTNPELSRIENLLNNELLTVEKFNILGDIIYSQYINSFDSSLSDNSSKGRS